MVFAQSELLEIVEAPITSPITGATIQLSQVPSGLVKGQRLVASGRDSTTGEAISEIVQVSAIDGKTLIITPPLKKSYVRTGSKPEESFSLNANVAHATHGETVSEVPGSGDASQRYQQFTLKQSPLTYVSAATASGAASTLELRVNDLLWHEATTLFGRDSQEHIYVTRTGDDSKTTIEFGDGVTGARLPSGQDNVRATYRKGIGVDGLVKAGQLTSLLTRPLGLKSVTNPEDCDWRAGSRIARRCAHKRAADGADAGSHRLTSRLRGFFACVCRSCQGAGDVDVGWANKARVHHRCGTGWRGNQTGQRYCTQIFSRRCRTPEIRL